MTDSDAFIVGVLSAQFADETAVFRMVDERILDEINAWQTGQESSLIQLDVPKYSDTRNDYQDWIVFNITSVIMISVIILCIIGFVAGYIFYRYIMDKKYTNKSEHETLAQ